MITLGIIGVVAALTMPALVMNYQEKVTVTKLKKFYSVMSQAYSQAIAENGEPDYIETGVVGKNAEILFERLKPYLNVSKDCGLTGSGCQTPGQLSSLDGGSKSAPDVSSYKFILSDGAHVSIWVSSSLSAARSGGILSTDVDGFKGPFVRGKDVFIFSILPDKIVPVATASNWQTACSANPTAKGADNGAWCTAWVIYNENMDYLHCDDLSWDGKTKCGD